MTHASARLITGSLFDAPSRTDALIAAAWVLAVALGKGRQLDARLLRTTLEDTFGASDAEGAWDWKDAYEASELAQVLYLRRQASALIGRRDAPFEILAELRDLLALTPSQTRRSENQVAFQQFSTPVDLAFVASIALDTRSSDVVLEPSAGTGLLAVFAEMAGARVHLNELDPRRAELLDTLFRDTPVTRLNAEQINDRLPASVQPNLVVMNPPFSVTPDVVGRAQGADFRHIASALARLAPGGRLVTITGAGLSPEAHPQRFAALQRRGATLAFTMPVDGRAYARHGTTIDTRLTIFDKVAPADAEQLTQSGPTASDSAALLQAVLDAPRRLGAPAPIAIPRAPVLRPTAPRVAARPASGLVTPPSPTFADVIELDYALANAGDHRPGNDADGIYETYAVESISIAGAKPHPTPLVQSTAMAAVRLPRPTYRPHLPRRLVDDGILSEAQLETIIYAGEAHSADLAGSWVVDETFDNVSAAPDGDERAVTFRKGFFLGDGTGAGKGRQLAGAILDNWLKGRRKAVWISKNDPLLEDAQRDWTALGGRREQIVPLSRFKQGAPITLSEGILFVTFGTLRSGARQEKASRLQQILDWLGPDFDGVVAIDEAHALANAAGEKGARGDRGPSEQGKAGLRLQNALPRARVLYVSATGATTVANLGYASRLGLWGGADFPFPTRASFVTAMEAGGVAAMEVLARDMKALGLYTSRALSYAGVEYEIVEHALTSAQIEIYDAYADAFSIIHNNLEDALKATGISSEDGGALNGNAKGAARSAFEGAKVRFFNHLVTAMKVPTLIRWIEKDLAEGLAPVIQLVSTGEAMTDRRLAEVPVSEWHDLQIDVTPREYVMDYLMHSFPVALFEPYSDEDGNMRSRPAVDAGGQPVLCQEALAQRDELIEYLGALPPVQAALDQIVHHFGTDRVAEVTGRSRRIVRKTTQGQSRLCVETRPGSANQGETAAFMDGKKPILVFSDAGGTGRSYHSDLGAVNQATRAHYLLEPGWRADAAVQGLGRTNRTNQKHPPIFRPVATNVKGEKRFLSTIARRLDSLGALTKGQRQTGGQGLFRPEDNLESDYAKTGLRRLYHMLYAGRVDGLTLGAFEAATGLSLCDTDGTLKEDLPPITQFLNRVLALRIDMQNSIFGYLEDRIEAEVEAAVAAGVFEVGVETLTAERFTVTARKTIFTHAESGAETRLLTVTQVQRVQPLRLADVMGIRADREGVFLINRQSGRAALAVQAPARMFDDGRVEDRVRLYRPMSRDTVSVGEQAASQWQPVEEPAFALAWQTEIDSLPETMESTISVVTGLLLPIWSRLPQDTTRVYRLQTDDGERIIGRMVAEADLGGVCRQFGLDAPAVSPVAGWAMVRDQGVTLQLAEDVSVRRSLVMGAQRIEVTGILPSSLPAMKAMGMMTEIISYRTRLFIPSTDAGADILARLVARYPLVSTIARPRAA
jgi:predicted RNA methylase